MDSSATLTTLLSLVAAGVPAAMLYATRSWRSKWGWWILAILWVTLCIGAWINIEMFIGDGNSLARPLLHNSDTSRWYYTARRLVRGMETTAWMVPSSLPYAAVMKLAGANVAVFIATNIAALTSAVVLTGSITHHLLADKRAAVLSMGMMSAVLYLWATATIPLKEPVTTLAMAIIGLALVKGRERADAGQLLLLAGGCALLALARMQYLLFAAAGTAMMMWGNRRDLSKSLVMIAIVMGVAIITLIVFSEWQDKATTDTYTTSERINWAIGRVDRSHEDYNSFAIRYFSMPRWLQLLCLPLTSAVQFLIPLPWTAMDHTEMGATMFVAHIGFTWYAIGALAIYFLLFCLKRAPSGLARMAAWWGVCYLAIAWITAGMISRYCLPLIPLMAPAAAWTWLHCRREKRFRIFAVTFSIALIAALMAALIIQVK